MQYNRQLQISTAGSRKATQWPASSILWSEFVDRLKSPVRSTETYDEYISYTKQKQSDLKDVGGFVGGTFEHDRRKSAYAKQRDLITLDLDNIPAGETNNIIKRVHGLGCASVIYSTRKHAEYAPRLRVVIPLDKTATADEYEPGARKLAELIGLEFCDPTTFDVERLMYWPSCSRDGIYVYEVNDYAFCSKGGLLGMYEDWKDVSTWPQAPGSDAIEKRRAAKQEDPTAKRGVVGAFCRTYSITEAMVKFIPGMYESTDLQGRYTYVGGSTTGGAVLYDGDMFLYSHHATDPCSGLLVNAFDLIRLHMYGDRDLEAKEGTPVNKLPSYMLMAKLALEDEPVSACMAREKFEDAQEAFGISDQAEIDFDWLKTLKIDGNGNYAKTINNAVLVLEYDPLLRGKIVTDEFANCGLLLGAIPWDENQERRRWRDSDNAGFYNYMETRYGITGKDKLDNALLINGAKHTINAVKHYLQSVTWDGQKRVDTLLSDYLGADDNPYTRAVIRKALCAAVARAVKGSMKYDYMPIFTGPQGIGKSTFLAILGQEWFSDSLTTFEGKEAAELIQGTWINEVGELTAMTKQETSAVKQFLSKTDDIYRAAYGKNVQKYPRRCVFFGTSNDTEFLKDATGNRRFWPVDVGVNQPVKSIWDDLPQVVDQIWAECYCYWMLGEKLFLPPEIEKLAQEQQEAHKEGSAKEGIILDYLDKKIPVDWHDMDVLAKRMFLKGLTRKDENELIERDKVCAAEIWVECLNGDLKYMKRQDSVEINNILKGLTGWVKNKNKRRYGEYGIQRGFERCNHYIGNT